MVKQVVDQVRHSVDAIRKLPPETQLLARHVYYEAIRLSFVASTAVALVGLVAALFTKGKGLDRH